ncbi:hypothetical protein D5281_11710 [bacterium 1xD42-62]|uniref:Uncharacterized protein n=1 Tax=Parablautia muri TaxID=2320879 RepID=A0A9X5BGJ5_9FIRM|nr:hypothetical protein [Parablautia muri]
MVRKAIIKKKLDDSSFNKGIIGKPKNERIWRQWIRLTAVLDFRTELWVLQLPDLVKGKE